MGDLSFIIYLEVPDEIREEKSKLNARRSIVSNVELKKGTIITEENIICKRPGTGISPEFWDQVVGSKVLTSLQADHVLEWQDLYKPFISTLLNKSA